MLVGYMRVSTDSDRQVLDLQRDALVAAGVDERHLFEDRVSGSGVTTRSVQNCTARESQTKSVISKTGHSRITTALRRKLPEFPVSSPHTQRVQGPRRPTNPVSVQCRTNRVVTPCVPAAPPRARCWRGCRVCARRFCPADQARRSAPRPGACAVRAASGAVPVRPCVLRLSAISCAASRQWLTAH